MSDATLPPPRRSSSAAPATAAHPRSGSSSGEGDFETALGQSTGFIARGEVSGDSEGRVDNKQKRKRTSPADQAVLESEFKQNPKPNKAARAEIVKKVSLNEKEVQIWFQNRRQINRRKSRPLLPHEIAAYGLGGIAALSSDPAYMTGYSSSPSMEEPEPSSPEVIASHEEVESCQDEVEVWQPGPVETPIATQSAVEVEVEAFVEDVAPPLPTPLMRQASSAIAFAESSSFSATENAAKSFSSTPGYLANRWNNVNSSFSTPASSQAPTFITPPVFKTTLPNSCPERIDETVATPSSHIRLSLSLDGKAELIETTPSPPRQYTPRPTSSSASMLPQRRTGLQRSQSAITFGPRPSMFNAGTALMPRLPTGRSRDARSWEQICCDGEIPDELTTQAENESSGSAIAAISLLRSSSSTALKANPNKRNAATAKHDSAKHGKKPKLGRAASSVARLQNPSKTTSKVIEDATGYTKDGLMRSPSGDSDKENWLPHENAGNQRRRPLPNSRADKRPKSRAVLGENNTIPSHAVDFGGTRNRKRKPAGEHGIFEDQEEKAEVGEEVQKFMRGEVSPSKKGDLDCIQGLLSLSQGNWR